MIWFNNLAYTSSPFAIPVKKAVDFEMKTRRNFDMVGISSLSPYPFPLTPAPAIDRKGKNNLIQVR